MNSNYPPIIAGIILFNPDIKRLQENIEAILPQVQEIIFIDNASNNHIDIEKVISHYDKTSIIKNKENVGIATALNQASSFAENKGYQWIVTLDQDSVVSENLIDSYFKFTNNKSIGIICCKIIDRNFGERKEQKIKQTGFEEIPVCITSASMMNLSAWKKCGGFPDDFFIDSVDFDLCLSMRENGYKIIRTNETVLLHEVGHSELRHFLGKEFQIYHHVPIRYYYMIRNCIYLGKRHHFICKSYVQALRLFILSILFEDNKREKISMMLLGFYHAIINKYGKL